MIEKLNSNNFIIVLGTTKSGSGAVFDYLSGRGDLYDPLNGTEYQVPQMPNGLMMLEAISKIAFHPPTADFVLSEFEKLAKKLFRAETPWQYGKNYYLKIPSFENEIIQFIEEICVSKLPMRLHWHRSMQSKSKIIYFFDKLKNYLGFNEKVPNTRLIVSGEDFVIATQKLHHRLFQMNSDMRPVLLNQAGSGWNPIESTKYFLNRKVVLVTRDPRDEFAELVQIKKANSVDGFVNWYKEMQFRLKKINNPVLLRLRFEDFVKKNNEIVIQLCDHLSLKSNILSSYEPNISKKNIGKYKKILSHNEIKIIENKLSEYIYV